MLATEGASLLSFLRSIWEETNDGAAAEADHKTGGGVLLVLRLSLHIIVPAGMTDAIGLMSIGELRCPS